MIAAGFSLFISLIPALGGFSLGTVVGLLIRFYLPNLKEYTPGSLGTIVTIMLGGAITNYLGIGKDLSAWGCYPIGLLVGIVAYPLLFPVEPSSNRDAGQLIGEEIVDPRIACGEQPGGELPISLPPGLLEGKSIDSGLIDNICRAICVVLREAGWDRACGSESDEHFDQVQQVILDIIATMMKSCFPSEGARDLGANFMHFECAPDPSYFYLKKMASPTSRLVYGRYLEECPAILVVGPTSTSAKMFSNFGIPFYPNGGKVLPGAPRAIKVGEVQEFRATKGWLKKHWPDNIDRSVIGSLVDHLAGVNFKYCLSFPVYDLSGKPAGVLNVNSSLPRSSITNEGIDDLVEAIRPHLLLLGWAQSMRRNCWKNRLIGGEK